MGEGERSEPGGRGSIVATMQVDVVSAEDSLYSGEARGVTARSTEGEIGILPGHQPLLIALGDAPVRVQTTEGRTVVVNVHNGFLEFRDNQLTVLADSAELG
jgi:F-type H+-transporting ATPase subunit epsilon